MANILRHLNINGTEYNIGYSQNDLTDELKAKYDAAESNAVSASAVTIAESAGTGDVLKTYTFSQNGAEIGKINLAKDLVVSGGQVVEKEGVKYLQLTIANQESPVEIAVTDLVDVYTGSTYINITEGNVVEVKFADLATALAAEGNAVGDKMKTNAEAAAAAQNTADGVRTDLGTAADAASAEGSAFARIAQVKADLSALSGEEGSVSEQIDAKIAAYNTATVQPIATDVATIKGDYLKASDKEELQGDIDVKVAQSDYDTKMTALDQSIAANAEDISTMGEKLSGISSGANKVTMEVEGETLKVTIA